MLSFSKSHPYVGVSRNAQGQGQLRELLNPLVKNMINDRNLLINTNPIDIYKKWVNQTETETGRARWVLSSETMECLFSLFGYIVLFLNFTCS